MTWSIFSLQIYSFPQICELVKGKWSFSGFCTHDASVTSSENIMSNDALVSKNDLFRKSAYQVSYSNKAIGKRFAASKRCIRWIFGFSDAAALSHSNAGPDGREEVHEIVMIWSVTSGKCRITCDNKMVYESVGKKCDRKFGTSWNLQGTDHIIEVPAFSSVGADSINKKYDLLLDGISFFDMPRINELGLRNGPTNETCDVSVSHESMSMRANTYEGGKEKVNLQSFDSSSHLPLGEEMLVMENKSSSTLDNAKSQTVATDIAVMNPGNVHLDQSPALSGEQEIEASFAPKFSIKNESMRAGIFTPEDCRQSNTMMAAYEQPKPASSPAVRVFRAGVRRRYTLTSGSYYSPMSDTK